MEKIIKFRPAFDKRNANPNKNYGIHGVEIAFVLKGELGAVQFVIFTNWHLPHVTEEFLAKPLDKMDIRCLFMPSAADVGYHSPKPMYEGQEPVGECECLDGKICYYDGSGLQAQDIFNNILLTEGSDGVWKELERRYKNIF